METYYSILSVQIRPEIQEKISVGFLLADANNIFFNISKNKISAAKSLLSDKAYTLLKDSLKSIQETASIENNSYSPDMIFAEFELKKTLSFDYIAYLNRYNNNILAFSAPKKIEVEATEDVFQRLYRKFVDETEKVLQPVMQPPIKTFKDLNRDTLEKHFNIDHEVTCNEIPSLIAPVKVDFLGQNDKPIYAQAIDLNRNVYYIENDLAQLTFLNLAFEKAEGVVLTSEPDKSAKKQHDIWKQLITSKYFTYYDFSEAQKLIEYAVMHNVQPFIATKK